MNYCVWSHGRTDNGINSIVSLPFQAESQSHSIAQVFCNCLCVVWLLLNMTAFQIQHWAKEKKENDASNMCKMKTEKQYSMKSISKHEMIWCKLWYARMRHQAQESKWMGRWARERRLQMKLNEIIPKFVRAMNLSTSAVKIQELLQNIQHTLKCIEKWTSTAIASNQTT